MRTGRITTIVFAMALLAGPAQGQGTAPAASASQNVEQGEHIGLETAVTRALEREPALRAVRSEVSVAEALRRQAALRPNPTLTFERRDEPRGTDSVTTFGVQWPLELYRRSARVGTAERTLEARRLGVADRERLLIAEVRMQYGAAAAAVRELSIADEILAAATQQWQVVRARVDAGGAPPLERDLLEVERGRLQVERLLAAGQADVALVHLKRLLGIAPDVPVRLGDTIEGLVTGGAEGATTAPAGPPGSASTRPDVREADARVRLAGAQVEQARRDGRVDVSLFGTYMRMDAGFPQQGVGVAGELERVRGRFNYVAGGAMVMVPLFNRNQGQVAAAEAEQLGAEARREATELSARAEVAAAQARDARARDAVAVVAGGIRRLARQNLDVVRQTFDLGRATVSDVLAEQRRYLEVEQAYTNTLREAWEARTALQRALGATR